MTAKKLTPSKPTKKGRRVAIQASPKSKGTPHSTKGKVSKNKSSLDKRKKHSFVSDPPPTETLPVCETGVGCIIGRDAAQNLVCWPFPVAERYVKANQTNDVIYTNT